MVNLVKLTEGGQVGIREPREWALPGAGDDDERLVERHEHLAQATGVVAQKGVHLRAQATSNEKDRMEGAKT